MPTCRTIMCPQSTILRLVASALLLSAIPLLPLSVSVSPAQAQPVLSTPLFQVEGVLEEGGTRLTEDDTLYAEHEFEGEAGQTITIVMESLEFDTYLP